MTGALTGNEVVGLPWVSLLEQAGTARNLATDAHIAALAIEHGATVVTFDRDFERFGIRVQLPT